MSYITRVGSLELATVIFWFLFWIANGLAKFIPGVNIGIRFGEPPGNPFAATLDKLGWGTSLGDAAGAIAGVYELAMGIIFLWVIVQFIMRTGHAARRPWILLGLFMGAILFAVFAFANVVTFDRPTPLVWHVTYFAAIGVSWIVIVMQGVWEKGITDSD